MNNELNLMLDDISFEIDEEGDFMIRTDPWGDQGVVVYPSKEAAAKMILFFKELEKLKGWY